MFYTVKVRRHDILNYSIAGHVILEATYCRDECFALLQLIGLVREAREIMILGIHAVYDGG
jgi:hypothetical protein